MRTDRRTDRQDEANSGFLAILQTSVKTQHFGDRIGPRPLAKSHNGTSTRAKNMGIYEIQKQTRANSNPAENLIP